MHETKLLINEPNFTLDIKEWNDITLEFLEQYSDWKCNGNNEQNIESIKQKPSDPEQNTQNIEQSDDKEIDSANPAILKSPNNTALFLNWIDTNEIIEFEVADFTKAYSYISKDQAGKIVSYQVQKKNLIQLSNTKFRVNIK